MITHIEEPVYLTNKQIRRIVNDPAKSARAVNLIYATDKKSGIERISKNDRFSYRYNNRPIRDKVTLNRIRMLALPPAWENLWICPLENGHLQATGTDSKNRKQYKYHQLWNQIRNQTKFYKMIDFGQVLPLIRHRLKTDLEKEGFPSEKVLATIVSLMEVTPIRVGNGTYEKLYGSFGLTTLKDYHAKITGHKMQFSFIGKKGIRHNISVNSKKLSKIVQGCKDIPGKELFQYYNDNGEVNTVDSGMVNEYIKEISGGEFTTKDFRTWSGTIRAFSALSELGSCNTIKQIRHNILAALDNVSHHLGNTRNVCKKYYVHPGIISWYESNSQAFYLMEPQELESSHHSGELTSREKTVLKILSSIQ